MTKKTKATRKTTTKSGTAKERSSEKRARQITRAVQSSADKKRGVVRTKPTKQERRATHKIRRKPFTGAKDARREINDYFDSGLALNELTEGELREKKLAFLRAVANRGIIRDGVIAAGITYKYYLKWKDDDASFADGLAHAEAMAADRLEAEAYRRGIEGFQRPVIYKGEITDSYTDYSDSLLQMMMKGYKRDKYKDRQEHSTPPGKPMQIEQETKENVVSTLLSMIKNKPDPS